MNPQEIRIDSIIKNGNDVGVVRSINHRNVVVYIEEKKAIEEWIYSGGMTGIPLTEEWLLKFGLSLNGDIYEDSMGDEYLLTVKLSRVDGFATEFFLSIKDDDSWEMAPTCSFWCKHVHQLQNLYYALTGKELTINK